MKPSTAAALVAALSVGFALFLAVSKWAPPPEWTRQGAQSEAKK